MTRASLAPYAARLARVAAGDEQRRLSPAIGPGPLIRYS